VPEVTRRYIRVHFIQPLKERIVCEVGYVLSLGGRPPPLSLNQRTPKPV
jgi:hypothetical protein